MRKGISLPIELIIVIAISVIVLLAAVSFFFTGLLTGQHSISNTQAWSDGCNMIKNRGCDLTTPIEAITIQGYNPNIDDPTALGTIYDACVASLGTGVTNDDCITSCCRQAGIAPRNPTDTRP